MLHFHERFKLPSNSHWLPIIPIYFFNYLRNLVFRALSHISIVNIFSLYSLYTKNKKVLRFYQKKIVDFQNLMTWDFSLRQIFVIVNIHKLSLGSCDVPNKIWARSVQSIGYKQTDKQRIQIDTLTFNIQI